MPVRLKNKKLRKCWHCHQTTGVIVCEGCHVAHYCNAGCQQAHWRLSHRSQCREVAELAESQERYHTEMEAFAEMSEENAELATHNRTLRQIVVSANETSTSLLAEHGQPECLQLRSAREVEEAILRTDEERVAEYTNLQESITAMDTLLIDRENRVRIEEMALVESQDLLQMEEMRYNERIESLKLQVERVSLAEHSEAQIANAEMKQVQRLLASDAHTAMTINEVDRRTQAVRAELLQALDRLSQRRTDLVLEFAFSDAAQMQGSRDECKVCLAAEIGCALIPCGHHAFCIGCAELVLQECPPLCPLCRGPVQRYLQTFPG